MRKSSIINRISELNEIYHFICARTKKSDVLRWLEEHFWNINNDSGVIIRELLKKNYLVLTNQLWLEMKFALDILFGLLDHGFQVNDKPIRLTGRICQLILLDYYNQIFEDLFKNILKKEIESTLEIIIKGLDVANLELLTGDFLCLHKNSKIDLINNLPCWLVLISKELSKISYLDNISIEVTSEPTRKDFFPVSSFTLIISLSKLNTQYSTELFDDLKRRLISRSEFNKFIGPKIIIKHYEHQCIVN